MVFLCALCASARKGCFPLLDWPFKEKYVWIAYFSAQDPNEFEQMKFFVTRLLPRGFNPCMNLLIMRRERRVKAGPARHCQHDQA